MVVVLAFLSYDFGFLFIRFVIFARSVLVSALFVFYVLFANVFLLFLRFFFARFFVIRSKHNNAAVESLTIQYFRTG